MIERSEQLVTVFGGGGFIGRYVCEDLFRKDARVRVASRDPRSAYFLQPLAPVGQWGRVRADVTTAASVREAVKDASAVINLVGTFGGSVHRIHVDGAKNIAEAARDAGATALVHISAIGSDPDAESAYGRSKGEGERAVRAAFPKATIIRPSIVFGPEDDLTNRLAALSRLPVLPVIAAKRRFQPIYVQDLAQAIATAAGFDAVALDEHGKSDAVAVLQKASFEAARAAGVFGVPTYRYQDELYWGQDSLPFLERHLRGEKLAA